MDSPPDLPKWLAYIENHLPIIAATLTGIGGVWATLRGVVALRRHRAMRLHKIEQAIGDSVLRGDDRLATVSSMIECRDAIVSSLEVHRRESSDHMNEVTARIDKLFELVASQRGG